MQFIVVRYISFSESCFCKSCLARNCR